MDESEKVKCVEWIAKWKTWKEMVGGWSGVISERKIRVKCSRNGKDEVVID